MVDSTYKSGGTPPRRTDANTAVFREKSDLQPWQMSDVDYDKPQRRPASSSARKRHKRRPTASSEPKGPVYARELTQEQWDHYRALREGIPPPARERERPVVTPVETPVTLTVEDVAERAEVSRWLNSKQKPWASLIERFSNPRSLTHLMAALWEKKYHSPVPDELIMVVHKNTLNKNYFISALSVFDPQEKTVDELHQRYPRYTIVSLRRQSDGHFLPVRPIAGQLAAELLTVALRGRGEIPMNHVAEQRLSIRAAGGVIGGKNDKLLWADFINYISSTASMVIPTLSDIQSTVDPNFELLPERTALTSRKFAENASAPVLMSWEDADKLEHTHSVVFFERVPASGYVMTRMKGAYAMDVVEAMLKGLNVFPEKPLLIEKLLVAGMLRDAEVKDVKPQLWNDYLGYVGGLGHGLWDRLLTVYSATHVLDPESETGPETLWIMQSRRPIAGVDHLKRFIVTDRNTGGELAAIQIGPSEKGTRILSINGIGALDMAIAWLNGIGFKIQGPIERAVMAGTWNYIKAKAPDETQVPTWERWRNYIHDTGTQGVFRRMRKIYEHVHMVENSPNDLLLVGIRRGSDDTAILGSLKVVSLEEGAHYTDDYNMMKLQFRRQPDGQEVLVNASGRGGKDAAKMLVSASGGGIMLAPEEDAKKREQDAALPHPENFGSTETLCKPEPLFTPAELVKLEPLVRPIDSVGTPKQEGFIGTNPDAVKKFQNLPSVGRLHAPKNSAVLALEILVTGAMVLLTRGTMIPQQTFGSGSVFFSPKSRFREGT